MPQNIQTEVIDDSAITAIKIASGAVTSAKIASGAAVANIGAGGITSNELAASAVTPAKMSQPLTLGTVTASTSGTSIPFTGIPSWVKRITISLNGVSLSGSALVRFRIGPSGGVATSGYLSASSVISSAVVTVNQTAGFDIYTNVPNAAYVYHGAIVFTLVDAATNTWAAQGVFSTSSVAWTHTVAGVVPLSGTLTQVAVTTSNGTDTFDAGSINILYE